jgi:hypothetical protein
MAITFFLHWPTYCLLLARGDMVTRLVIFFRYVPTYMVHIWAIVYIVCAIFFEDFINPPPYLGYFTKYGLATFNYFIFY